MFVGESGATPALALPTVPYVARLASHVLSPGVYSQIWFPGSDGMQGFVRAVLQSIQIFHIKVKIYEQRLARKNGSREVSSMHSDIRYHDQLAATWTARYKSPRFAARADAMLGLLEGIDVGDYWLDAGCGTGVLSMMLAARGSRVLGVDTSPAMIAEARKQSASFDGVATKGPVKFEEIETIERMAIAGETFSGVLCSSVMEYLGDPGAATREMYRVLKPGGFLLVSVPNRKSLWRRTERLIWFLTGRTWPKYLTFSRQSFSRQELEMLLESAGFSVHRVSGFAPRLPTMIGKNPSVSTLFIALAEKRVRVEISKKA